MPADSAERVYKPPLSIWPFIIHLGIASFFLWSFMFMIRSGVTFSIAYIIMIPASVVLLFLIGIYPTMQYKFGPNALILICGPFKKVIEYGDITSVYKTDLRYSYQSTGWLFPGYALFHVYFTNEDYVWMCATRALSDVTVIKTKDSKKYGVTPRDENKFIRELEQHLPEQK